MFRLRKVMIWREFVGLGKQGDKAAARGPCLGLAAGVPHLFWAGHGTWLQHLCPRCPAENVHFATRQNMYNVLYYKLQTSVPPFWSILNVGASSCSWLSSCTAPVKGPSRRAKTQWQWRTDRACGRQPIVPCAKCCFLNCSETSFKLSTNLEFACLPALPASNLLASSCCWLSSWTAPVKGLQPIAFWTA